MSFRSLLKDRFKIMRRTNELLATTTIAATHTLDRAADDTTSMLVTIAGADPTGTVTLIGNVAGVSTTEVLPTYTRAASRQSRYQWDNGTLTEIQTSGFTGTIKVEAVEPGGTPNNQNIELIAAFPARLWDRQGQNITVDVAGREERHVHTLFMYHDATPIRGGDVAVHINNSNKEYLVLGPGMRRSRSQLKHHWEVQLGEID